MRFAEESCTFEDSLGRVLHKKGARHGWRAHQLQGRVKVHKQLHQLVFQPRLEVALVDLQQKFMEEEQRLLVWLVLAAVLDLIWRRLKFNCWLAMN